MVMPRQNQSLERTPSRSLGYFLQVSNVESMWDVPLNFDIFLRSKYYFNF